MAENDLGKIWYLKKINLLEPLTKEQMDYLASHCAMQEYKPKEIIYHPKKGQNLIFFLKKGLVRLYRLDPNGKEYTLALLGQGESFGALASFSEKLQESPSESQDEENQNPEFAQALEPTLVCFIPKELFFEMTKESPLLHLRISKMLGLRLIEVSMLVEEMAFKSVIQRVASLLLRLDKKFGKEIKGERVISLSLTHYDLSTMIGATREATTVALDKLKKLEAIEIRRKRIILKNSELLKEIQRGF